MPGQLGAEGGGSCEPTGNSVGKVPPGAKGQFKDDEQRQQEQQKPTPTAAVESFLAQLAEEERMLLLLQQELYDGDWQAMLTDLRNRLQGKPYIFKLANRINDDIARIERLEAFEKEHHVRLADFVEPPKR